MTRRVFKYVYDHGLPFSETLGKDVIKPLMSDLKRQPATLIIDGGPGTGKTTLAVHILDYIHGRAVDLKKDACMLAMGGKDLLEKAQLCREKGYKAIVYDEADLTKMGANTRYNNQMLGFFREYRSLEILLIVVIQNVSWLDNKLWQVGMVEGLIHLHTPTKENTSFMVYDLTNISFLLERMERLGQYRNRQAYKMCKGYCHGQFLRLPPDRQGVLDAMSNLQKDQSRKRRIKQMEDEAKGVK